MTTPSLLLLTSLIAGPEAWLMRSPAEFPQARAGVAMLYDEHTGHIVLFGGVLEADTAADTWRYDGDTWTRLGIDGPSARGQAAIAYDANAGRAILFGGGLLLPGQTKATVYGDTWALDEKAWIALATDGPPARQLAATCYDRGRHETVLYGGIGDTGELGDTWLFDGTSWRDAVASDPGPRVGAAMAYDESRDECVLFGGYHGPAYLADLWTWDGSGWHAHDVATGPSGRAKHSMAYDSARGRVILFGGTERYETGDQIQHRQLQDVWEWDGDAWEETLADGGPSARERLGLSYDRDRRRLVLFGGGTDVAVFGDTWEYASKRSHLSCAATSFHGIGLAVVTLLFLVVGRRRAQKLRKL